MNRKKEGLMGGGIRKTKLENGFGKGLNRVNLTPTKRVQPPIPVLYRIAEILNVDVRTLLVPNEIKK